MSLNILSKQKQRSTVSFLSFASGRTTTRRRRRQLFLRSSTQNHDNTEENYNNNIQNEDGDRRQRRQSQQQNNNRTTSSRIKDTRTIRDILWPDPFYDDDNKLKKSFREEYGSFAAIKEKYNHWTNALKMTIWDYKKSWHGFFTTSGFIVPDDDDDDDDNKDVNKNTGKKRADDLINSGSSTINTQVAAVQTQNTAQEKQEKIIDNVRRNIRNNTKEIKNDIMMLQNKTGIHNIDDMKLLVRNLLQLGSNCIQEFMIGYRKGRDDEIDLMLTNIKNQITTTLENQYQKIHKKQIRKRKIKRRIIK